MPNKNCESCKTPMHKVWSGGASPVRRVWGCRNGCTQCDECFKEVKAGETCNCLQEFFAWMDALNAEAVRRGYQLPSWPIPDEVAHKVNSWIVEFHCGLTPAQALDQHENVSAPFVLDDDDVPFYSPKTLLAHGENRSRRSIRDAWLRIL